MASLDLARRHVFVAVALAGLLVGGIAGLFFPIRAASPPKSSSDAWALPSATETDRFRTSDYTALGAARFWNPVASPGQRAAPTTNWTLAAIITRPRPMAAISVTGAKPSILVALGAELPDGSTLVGLTRDVVWFEKDGCRRERRLYRAVTSENDACIDTGTPAVSTPDGPMPSATPAKTLPPAASKTP